MSMRVGKGSVRTEAGKEWVKQRNKDIQYGKDRASGIDFWND